MSILNNTIDPATTAANFVRSIASQQFNQLFRSGVQGFNLIWKNPNATPAQVLAALGTDAQAIFQLAALNITTVNSAATIGGTTAPSIPSVPSQYVLTFNDDGSANLATASSSSSGS